MLRRRSSSSATVAQSARSGRWSRERRLTSLVTASLALAWVDLPRINVPPESAHLDALRSLGFETRRELRHMRRGIDNLPGRRACVAAQASLGEG